MEHGKQLLLLAVDALDLIEIDRLTKTGHLPTLSRMVSQGTTGDLAGLHPEISSMLWTAATTGKRAYQHGILADFEIENDRRTPISSQHLSAKPVWQILSEQGIHASSLCFPASHPVSSLSGTHLSNAFHLCEGDDPEETPLREGSGSSSHGIDRFQSLRVTPEDLDQSVIESFVLEFDPAMKEQQPYTRALNHALCETFSTQAAALEILNNDPWEFLACRFSFMGTLAPLFFPFSKSDTPLSKHYGGTWDRLYFLLDVLLKELLATAGESATVILVSNGGLQKQPPQELDWNRWKTNRCAFIATGPPIQQGKISAKTLMDLTPSILRYFGLPPARDLIGAPITELTKGDPILSPVETYEEEATTPQDSPKIPPPEWQWNRANDSADASLWAISLPDLLAHCELAPDNLSAHALLASAYTELGEYQQAERVLDDFMRLHTETPELHFAWARVAMASGDHPKSYQHAMLALQLIEQPTALDYLRCGHSALAAGQPAEELFQNSLSRDPSLAKAHEGMAQVHYLEEKYSESIEAALRALELEPGLLDANLCLGDGLHKLQMWSHAEEAYRVALAVSPNHLGVIEKLIALFEIDHPQPAKAAEMQQLYISAKSSQAEASLNETSEPEFGEFEDTDEESLF